MASTSGPEPIAGSLEPGLPFRLHRVLDYCLKAAVNHGWNAEWTELAAGLRDVHAAHGPDLPGLEGGQFIHQLPSGEWRLHHQLVYARRVLASIGLRHPPD